MKTRAVIKGAYRRTRRTGETDRTAEQAGSVTRRYPIGAEVQPSGGVHFRVWAPKSKSLSVELSQDPRPCGGPTWLRELQAEGGGYFSGHILEAEPGGLYRLRLDTGCFPDPASRFQPDGPHGPSQIVEPGKFRWTDAEWGGVSREGQVLYEMHIGTFTREGTWGAAMAELPELAGLGITVIELMPVADFPGRYGWGYDGVNLYAPTRLYGHPDDFRAFVNRAHELGLGVILDVVYNHLGPDGNFLKEFSDHYFSDRYKNEWGEAINFDGEHSGAVREFFISNASYWIDEYHLDGLRLDATQQIFDSSPEHVLAAIVHAVRNMAGKRHTYVVAENEPQDTRIVRGCEEQGHGCDALWNDDFHHTARVALTGHSEAYYLDYGGTPQEFISTAKWGYLYQGQWYRWQQNPRGTTTRGVEPGRFINYLENHDQLANSLCGLRLNSQTSPALLRTMTALLLLSPGTPMLFQGQEFAPSTPFLYFADHTPELARLVAKGRREFLHQFKSIAGRGCAPYLTDPGSADTFMRSKLDFSEREKHAGMYALHRDLLKLRREDPVLGKPTRGGVDGAVLGTDAFVLRYFAPDVQDRLLVVNMGKDLEMKRGPEPLIAPPAGHAWAIKWSSEDPRYGGGGTPPCDLAKNWCVPGQSALWVAPERV